MTVRELRDLLLDYPDDLKVLMITPDTNNDVFEPYDHGVETACFLAGGDIDLVHPSDIGEYDLSDLADVVVLVG